MLPFLARHVICPVHEQLLRRPTFRYLRGLEESQWLSPDDIGALQREKLKALLDHARTNTRFYRQRFELGGLNSDLSDPLEALHRIPLLDKAQIRSSIDDMLWQDASGGRTAVKVFSSSTGGSTGEPLQFHVDRRRQAVDQAARIRSHRWFGVDQGDRELYLWGSPIELSATDRARRIRDWLFNHRLLSAFDMSPSNMDAYLDEYDRFQPACLFGYPSSIALLADHAMRRGRRLNTGALRTVFVTGEVCYPHHRDTIVGCFNVPVADGYGSREAGFIAHQCAQGNMHVTAENVLVEIISDGRPVPVGESGEIVVTHLDAYAMPFIRYRTGDMGRLRPGRCSCGRGLPMMDVIEGRTTDFLHLPDGTIKHALSIIYPLRAMPGVRQFRVTQHADCTVTVAVVPTDPHSELIRDDVIRAVSPVIGGGVSVDVELVDRIPLTDSGKHRYVVSHAQPAGQRKRKEAVTGV